MLIDKNKNLGFSWKKLKILMLVILATLLLQIQPAFAHRPHDVIHQLEISPQFEQDQTLYIIVRSNLFKSTDAGKNWNRISQGLTYRFNIGSLSIHQNQKNVLYLSTLGDGVYKSEDAGNSWTQINQGLDTSFVDVLAISPQSPNLVLLGADKLAGKKQGLYRTSDGGKNWTKVFDSVEEVTAIAFNPQQPNQAIMGNAQGNLYKSNDQGKSWEKIDSFAKNQGKVMVIAFAPNSSLEDAFFVGTYTGGLYKATNQGQTVIEINQGIEDKSILDIVFSPNYQKDATVYTTTWTDGLYESKDRGKSWKKHNNGLTRDSMSDEQGLPHFKDLRFSDQVMYLGGFNGLFLSKNQGQSWQEIDTLLPETITALDISPNYQNDSTLVVGTYVKNIFISRDKGVTWKPANRGLELPFYTGVKITQNEDPRRYFDVAFSDNYAKDETIYAGTLWSRIAKSNNQGNYWKLNSLPQAVRGINIVPSPNSEKDHTVFATNQFGIVFKSTDDGKTFSKLSEPGKVAGNYGPSLIISPNFENDQTLFMTVLGNPYKSVDGGKIWENTFKEKTLQSQISLQLVISQNYATDQTVLAGTQQGVYITQDGGTSWRKIENQSFSNVFIEGLDISPNYKNDRTFMISTRGKGLYKTEDGGNTFTQIGDPSITLAKFNNLPSAGRSIQFSPAYAIDNTIYGFGSSQSAVYKSTDGGNTWEMHKIPRPKEGYNLETSIRIFIHKNRFSLFKIALALIPAILGYFILGYFGLEKKLPLSRLQVKAIGAFLIFLISLLISFA